MQFSCDLEPDTNLPRVRLQFENGWDASLLFYRPGDLTRYALCSVAACPTGQWNTGKAELLDNEASADQVAALLTQVSEWEPPKERNF